MEAARNGEQLLACLRVVDAQGDLRVRRGQFISKLDAANALLHCAAENGALRPGCDRDFQRAARAAALDVLGAQPALGTELGTRRALCRQRKTQLHRFFIAFQLTQAVLGKGSGNGPGSEHSPFCRHGCLRRAVGYKTGPQLCPGVRQRAERGELCAGTVDSWLIWNLTGGKAHVTDYSNASRTMMFNIHTLEWDDEILQELNIPKCMLPKPVPSSGFYEYADPMHFGGEIKIAGAAGDQQAALFGQTCFSAGEAKNTFGTGGFLLMNTGKTPVISQNGLVTTIAWGLNGKVEYALEGSVFVAGAAIQWLRDELGLIGTAHECDILAESVPDNGGVYLVSAFTGLGAPRWDMYARGAIVGLTRGSNKAHIARATLEGIAYQVKDLLDAMQVDAESPISVLRVDGGASVSSFLMQFQADMLRVPIDRPKLVETTAFGAAFLAGMASGVWESVDDIALLRQSDRIFKPEMDAEQAKQYHDNWLRAVGRAEKWSQE